MPRRVSLAQLLLRYDDRDQPPLPPRPRTRADCANGPRPCPWVGCRHHLYYASRSDGATWRTPHGLLRDDQVADYLAEDTGHTCSLDAADDGERTLEEVGDLLGVVKERVRQCEEAALRRLAHDPEAIVLRDEYLDDD